MKVAIVGGGLAGCALAYSLKCGGAEPVIYEATDTLASKASGNSLGLYNPRLSAHRNEQSDYFVAAFSLALQSFPHLKDIDWNPCGALHLAVDEKRDKKFAQTIRNWGWEPEHMQLLDVDGASEVAGIALQYGGLYLPDAGVVSPWKLCRAYAEGVEVHYNTVVDDLESLEADAVVLACAYGAKAHLDWLPLSQVRGQVTDVQATALSKKLKCNICYNGFISPAYDGGVHVLGATFQRWLEHDNPMVEDNADNLQRLEGVAPRLAKGLKVCGHRAGVRVATKDYFPIVGRVGGRDSLYVSTGHGSYGIISSLMAGCLLSDMILGRPYSLGRDSVTALSPDRFL